MPAPGPGDVGDEVFGQQRQEPGARGRIGVDDLKGGLDDRHLRRGGLAEPQEPVVGSQGSLRHDRVRAAAAGQRRRFGQGRKGAGIVGLLLRVAEPDEEISVFVIGNVEGGAVVQRRPVPPGRFGRGQLPGQFNAATRPARVTARRGQQAGRIWQAP